MTLRSRCYLLPVFALSLGASSCERPDVEAQDAEHFTPAGSASSASSTAVGGAVTVNGGASSAASQPTPSMTAPAPIVDAVGLKTIAIQHDGGRVLSRLTNAQILNAAAELLAIDTSSLAGLLPEMVPNAGYSNAGYAQSQPYDLIQGMDSATSAMVTAVSDWETLTARYGGCTATSCLADFVAALGERAFRRPLQAEEVANLTPILTAAAENGLDFSATAGLLVRALLQAPEFLYLFEDAELNDFQLAARLAFFVTDGPPDAELYAEAKAGTLRNQDRLTYHVDRLLTAHGKRFAHAFVYDYFSLRKAYQRTVDVDDATITSLIESLQATFAQMIESDAPIAALLTTREFAVNPATASYLGQPEATVVVQAPNENGFMGLVTHPAALIAISNAYEGSTVSRGSFLAHQLLCIPPTPPPSRAFSPTDVSVALPPNPTQRDEAEARLQDPNCSGCHTQFEPYAFALNRWGGDGLYNPDPRLLDDGPMQTTLGELTFSGYASFLPQLAESAQYQRCTIDHLLRYALRHTEYDESVVDSVQKSVSATGAELTFRALIRAVVQQPVFSNR